MDILDLSLTLAGKHCLSALSMHLYVYADVLRHVWLTLCDSTGCSPPGSSVHGIFQVRMLEWVALPSPDHLPDPGIEPTSLASPSLAGGFFTSRAAWEAEYAVEKWKYSLSRVQLFSIPWTVACQVPLAMEFSRQEHWNGLPFPSSGDLPDSGIKPVSPTLRADSLLSEPL